MADLVLWTAGSGPATRSSGGALALPFPADNRGALRTDATLRVLDHPRVFALGDVAGPASMLPGAPDGRLPLTAQVRGVCHENMSSKPAESQGFNLRSDWGLCGECLLQAGMVLHIVLATFCKLVTCTAHVPALLNQPPVIGQTWEVFCLIHHANIFATLHPPDL